MKTIRKVLIVSPHWPPINAPDMQRVRMSLDHYKNNGWAPTVLAVHPDDVAGMRESDLISTYGAETPVIHCRALPRNICSKVGLGNLGLRAWFALKNRGSRLLSEERFDLVFFSTTQFILFTLGPLWEREHRVPFVIDIQDPWRTDFYERPGAPKPPGGAKYLLARFLANTFEEFTYRRTSGFISVSKQYLLELSERYPGLNATPSDAIEFGGTRSDLAIAEKLPKGPNHPITQSGKIHIVYTRAAGPIVPDAVELLFEGFSAFRKDNPHSASKFHFHFIGTSYVEHGSGTAAITPIASKYEISDQVTEVPHRIGHMESLSIQMAADALFLGGSKDLAYSPSKIYPYYLSGRPILSLIFPGSVLEGVLRCLNCEPLIPIEHGEARKYSIGALCNFFASLSRGQEQAKVRDLQMEKSFLPENLTRRQSALFDLAVEWRRQN